MRVRVAFLSLFLLLLVAEQAHAREYRLLASAEVSNHWPGADGLIGTKDDVHSGDACPTSKSDPNSNGDYSYISFSGEPGSRLFPSGRYISFVEGFVTIDDDVAGSGGGPLITDWHLAGTEFQAGGGDFDSRITLPLSGSYQPESRELVQDVSITGNVGPIDAKSLADYDLAGEIWIVDESDYGTTGNTYLDERVCPLARDGGHASIVYCRLKGKSSDPYLSTTMTFVGYEIQPQDISGNEEMYSTDDLTDDEEALIILRERLEEEHQVDSDTQEQRGRRRLPAGSKIVPRNH